MCNCVGRECCEDCIDAKYEKHLEDMLGLNEGPEMPEPRDLDPDFGMSESDYIPRGIPQVPTSLREPDCDWKECPGEDIPF